MFRVHLAKEPFKFSCSHFTILAPDRAERLHGHNYRIRVEIGIEQIDPRLGMAFDFNAVKPLVRALCERLDERILLPTRSPYCKVRENAGRVDAAFNGKQYSFPAEDVALLPVCNITSEELARLFVDQLSQELKALPAWNELCVNVEETPGQSVSYTAKA